MSPARHLPPLLMLKKKQSNAVPLNGMHPGRVDLVDMLRTVAPFLFGKKKVERKPTVRIVSAKPTATKKTKKTKAKPARKAVSTLTATKITKEAKKTISASKTIDPLPAPVAIKEEQPKGKIIVAKPEQAMSQREMLAEKEALLSEEGFMSKVLKSAPAGSAPIEKRSFWGTLFQRVAKDDVMKLVQGGLDLKDDKFLQRVQQKRSDSVVGTAVDDPNAPPPPDLGINPTASALESFAAGKEVASKEPVKGKIITAAELKKEAQAAKDAAARSVEETKKEMKEEEKQQAAAPASALPKKEEPAAPEVPHKKIQPFKAANGFQKFSAAIEHFGMGKERMQFVENLATMLDAGLPLVEAVRTLMEETRNKGFKKILARIVDRVENGIPLWRSMDAENLFSLHAIALIRIGEEAGNLAKNMQYLAAQETKDHELVQKVKMAMIYPSIVLTIMFIIVMGLGMFVLPNLIGVLTSLNVPLPFITRMVIAFSDAFSKHGLIILPGSIGGIIVFIILAKYTPLKVAVQWVTFRIPGIGSLLRSATIARFGVILGGLLQAGVPVVDSVQSLVEVTPILVYKHFYEKLRDHITIGDSFAKSFATIKGSQKVLPVSVQQLVITGEKSGALAVIMLKIADIYDKKASETAQKLPVILEPILLLIIGSLVGTIAFAIIVPIYSIVGSVGR